MNIVDRQHSLEGLGLDRSDLDADAFAQFARWFDEAKEWGVSQPEAMVLATASAEGRPSARHVLLKAVDDGLVFFTNYSSRKASELDSNPQAALCFGWIALSRQVRVAGAVSRVSEDESDRYFASRPRASQIGAWASTQSEVIDDRLILDTRASEAEQRFAGHGVARPPGWGGYRVVPTEFEFWQGRPNRLHDRFRYLRTDYGWQIDRLSP